MSQCAQKITKLFWSKSNYIFFGRDQSVLSSTCLEITILKQIIHPPCYSAQPNQDFRQVESHSYATETAQIKFRHRSYLVFCDHEY